MFDGKEELLQKISLGEDSLLELKAVTFRGGRIDGPRRDDLADDLAGIANSRDAVVVLGVDDTTREILGIPVERLDAVEAFVRELCNDSITPPLTMSTIRMTLPSLDGSDRAVLRIDVPRSLFIHRSPRGYFHRVGSSTRQLSPEALGRLMQQRSQSRLIRYDENVVATAALEDLDRGLVERFRGRQSSDTFEVLLHKLAMARNDDRGMLRPTVTGVLLGTPEPQRWVPNAFIQAVAYRGTTVVPGADATNYQLDAADIYGPLDAQVRDACSFVRKNMRIGASKTEGRTDHPQYDMPAVFEALVNAVAHRDYSMYASKIRLRMFADRLEIFSPGALANTMDVESLAFRQSARNEAIASLLAKIQFTDRDAWIGSSRQAMMDKRGEGVSVILDRSERNAGLRPAYVLHGDSELQLTIFGPSGAESLL